MSFESDLFDAIKALVGNRVIPDVAPVGTTRPYVTFQKVGGDAINYLESTHPGRRHARVQINCWASTRATAAALARSIEVTLVQSTVLRAYVNGAVVDTYEGDVEPPLYGTRQDFSISYV